MQRGLGSSGVLMWLVNKLLRVVCLMILFWDACTHVSFVTRLLMRRNSRCEEEEKEEDTWQDVAWGHCNDSEAAQYGFVVSCGVMFNY